MGELNSWGLDLDVMVDYELKQASVCLATFLIPLALEDEVEQSIVYDLEGNVFSVVCDDGVAIRSKGDVV